MTTSTEKNLTDLTRINEWINERDAPLHYWCSVDAPAETRYANLKAALENGHNYLVNELDHTKNVTDNRGTPLHCALDTRSAHPEDNRKIIELLIKYGADPAIKDLQGRTAIDLCSPQACEKVSPAVLELWKELLPHLQKADERLAPHRGPYDDPLHTLPLVCQPIGFRWPMFKAAVEAGADVNEPERARGKWVLGTPLFNTVSQGDFKENYEMTKLLLAHGADPRIKDMNGQWNSIEIVQGEVDLARRQGRDVELGEKILEMLKEAARKLEEKEAREKEGMFYTLKRFLNPFINH